MWESPNKIYKSKIKLQYTDSGTGKSASAPWELRDDKVLWACVVTRLDTDSSTLNTHTRVRPDPQGPHIDSQQSRMVEPQNGRLRGSSSDKSLSGMKVVLQDEEHVHTPEIKTS